MRAYERLRKTSEHTHIERERKKFSQSGSESQTTGQRRIERSKKMKRITTHNEMSFEGKEGIATTAPDELKKKVVPKRYPLSSFANKHRWSPLEI